MAGEQYSTINKDTRLLVAQAIAMVKDLQAGKKAPSNDTTSYDNGVKVVPAFLLPRSSSPRRTLPRRMRTTRFSHC